eukprot:scaffold4055_cov51-Phaeocystis_antarctica.AAC.3
MLQKNERTLLSDERRYLSSDHTQHTQRQPSLAHPLPPDADLATDSNATDSNATDSNATSAATVTALPLP